MQLHLENDQQLNLKTFRSHQVPMASPQQNPGHLEKLEKWLLSYEPHSLFDYEGKLLPELKALVPPKELRMGNNPYTNPHYRPLILPDFGEFGIENPKRGSILASDATLLGYFLKRVIELNAKSRNFRIFGPDETKSNRLGAGESFHRKLTLAISVLILTCLICY